MGINEIVQIGTKIKETRLKKHIRQKDMAEDLNIPVSTYANYEANRREPDMDTILAIADILDVSIDYLIMSNIIDYDEYQKKQSLIGDATKQRDPRKLEQALGVPTGTILSIGADGIPELEARVDLSADEHIRILKEELEKERKKYSIGAKFLVEAYNKLNGLGKREAHKRINELTLLTQYTKKDLDGTQLNAAHQRTDIELTDEMAEHDEKIMDDDDF